MYVTREEFHEMERRFEQRISDIEDAAATRYLELKLAIERANADTAVKWAQILTSVRVVGVIVGGLLSFGAIVLSYLALR